MRIVYILIYSFCYLVSLLPFWVLYRLSDVLFYFLYYCLRYRRGVVRRNLSDSFPEKKAEEILSVEKKFYAFFCDYLVETLKLFSLSKKGLKKRMIFEGVPEMVQDLEKEGKNFGFIYLGHYCNWEWISGLSSCIHAENNTILSGQIYHPLRNGTFDRLFLKLRSRFGGENIAMKETLRRIIQRNKAHQKTLIGFISDQTPKWNSIHHWTNFMGRETPVFTGTERIGKQVDALVYYAEVERPKRGYYRCRITRMVRDIRQYPDFEVTDLYMQKLEETIRRNPQYWLWSHRRWKRTPEEFEARKQKHATSESGSNHANSALLQA